MNARGICFDYKPISSLACSLGTRLAELIETWEADNKPRKRRRTTKDRERLCATAGRLGAELLLAAQQDRLRWSYFIQSPNAFSGEDVSYTAWLTAREALFSLGLLEYSRGFSSSGFGAVQTGRASRIRATRAFFEMALEMGLTPHNVPTHFMRRLPARPLVLKATSHRGQHGRKEHGRRMKYERVGKALGLERDIKELNAFLDTIDITGGVHRGYKRHFNLGDHPDFDWNKGGRLYSQGEESYQRLKKERRLQMRFDGEPIVELDIRSSYLTILYAAHGQSLDPSADPYAVPGVPRDVVKAWITMTLGYDRFHRRWSPEAKKDLEKKGHALKGPLSIIKVREAVLRAHPLLSDWPDSEITWADLMFLESRAVVNTSLRMMWEYGAPCLSVHDSVIVKRLDQAVASAILKEEYQKSCGATPILTVQSAPQVSAL